MQRLTIVIVLLAVYMMLLSMSPGIVHAGFTQITPSSLKYFGVKYWRKKADEAMLGSVGDKKTPVGSKNYFQKIQSAPNGIFDVTASGETVIESKKANEWGVTFAASNVSGTVSGSGKHKGKVSAYKMNIDLGDLKGNLRYETNRHIGHLNALKDLGNSGRLISAVWILVDGNESQNGCYSGKLNVTGNGWTVSPSASGCRSSTWTIPPGSILAYEMVKVKKWDKQELTKGTSCPESHPDYDVRSSVATPKDRCKKTSWTHVGIQCKLLITDNKKNWYISNRAKRDTCKSKKGKDDKDVKCSKSGYDYVAQEGRDTCKKAEYSYKDPTCPNGYDYDKKSTGNNGRDQCHLKGIAELTPDSQDGF